MCYIVMCNKCDKKSWAGCGKHIELVKSQVPTDERCSHVRWD